MDKDLYIYLLEREIRAGGNQLYGMMAAKPLPDWDPEILREELQKTKERYQQAEMDLRNRDEEIQDLKLENDRLAKRDDKMRQVIRAIACDPDCEFCLLHGTECSGIDMQHLAAQTLNELEEL